ncbi:(2Fe-2S) ferredoxin domain-containing protein [Laspinema sp. D1]|uniref:(2Fe-2S) ferredoxin domain-containing protein n=1 Tax=Laspinema palackyanum D2a TaxID=2953684 RepID=A0ABT2MZP4_9CYAN|nr:(2Fe-2S) ferredoxin domain-containing protein [Laspinema sp. D2b]MCT7970229.1 (2Fe-2S) ferredoxin domain-containing protein [Laspinema sp. D2a]
MTPKRVLICTNRTCRKQGSQKVLATFQSLPVANVTVESSSCLGQCGNGPMVLILPEETWYSQVQPGEVKTVVEKHLQGGIPVKGMLYPKFHPK